MIENIHRIASGKDSLLLPVIESIACAECDEDLVPPIKYLMSLLTAYTWMPQQIEIKEIPGKGKGMVASIDFEPGEIIFKERPLFVVRFDPTPDVDDFEKVS